MRRKFEARKRMCTHRQGAFREADMQTARLHCVNACLALRQRVPCTASSRGIHAKLAHQA